MKFNHVIVMMLSIIVCFVDITAFTWITYLISSKSDIQNLAGLFCLFCLIFGNLSLFYFMKGFFNAKMD